MCPYYEYLCKKCKGRLEFYQSMKDAPKKMCPLCGKNALQKLISLPIHMTKVASKYDGKTPHRITLGNKKTKRNS